MISNTTSLEGVKSVLVETLGIENRADTITAATELFGNLPELDSLAVLELVTAIEDHFNITINDEEFGGEIFETLGSLANFVDGKRMQMGVHPYGASAPIT
jgi:acyl carrier protein